MGLRISTERRARTCKGQEIVGRPCRELALDHQLGPNPDGTGEVFAWDRGKRWLREWAELRQSRQQVPLDILRKTGAKLAGEDQLARVVIADQQR